MICFVGCYGSYPGRCRLARRAGSPLMPPLWARRRSAPDWPFMSTQNLKVAKLKLEVGCRDSCKLHALKPQGPARYRRRPPDARTSNRTFGPGRDPGGAPGPGRAARGPRDAATQAPQSGQRDWRAADTGRHRANSRGQRDPGRGALEVGAARRPFVPSREAGSRQRAARRVERREAAAARALRRARFCRGRGRGVRARSSGGPPGA